MDSNLDTSNLPFDCQGSCKTPIGCTCINSIEKEKEKEVKQEVEAVMVEVEQETVAKTSEYKLVENKCSKKGASCCCGTHKLEVFDWLQDLPEVLQESQMVEVQFKNTRKGYYLNSNNFELHKGDIVAVEATPGHDIGEVTLTGKLVQLQMLKNNYRGEVKRIYRIAKPNDIEKWEEAKIKEHKTMLRAREIAEELKLGMKISDVEFQGDGNKAIFYYIADERVDFRQLIKVYASEFRVKIEMKQIGARQEAGRVGGIGPCGRQLCCSSSMSNFISVSTSAARLQDIPLNPQKLAGQCGKLKCCLNFEVDTYVEAQRMLPSRDIVLETKDASYYHFKTDILLGMMTYSTDKNFAANLVTLPKDRVYEVMRINKRGERPLHLIIEDQEQESKSTSHDILQENINRFDNNNDRNKKKKVVKGKPGVNDQNGNGQAINKPVINKNNSDQNKNRPQHQQANKPQQQVHNKQQVNNKPQQNVVNQSVGEDQLQAGNNQQHRNKNNNQRNNKNRRHKNGKPDQKNPEA